MPLFESIERTLRLVEPDVSRLPEARRGRLDRLVAFVCSEREARRTVRLNFICTHNSRRSHLGQLWAAAVAHRHGFAGLETFSGGTEATAFNPRAVAAIVRAGFWVRDPGGDNPRYEVAFAADAPAQICFSKVYDDATNPTEGFAAVMTCTDADQNCPVVLGAAARISLPYDDPKIADGTPEEEARYDERSRQIATEMLYVFEKVTARS